MSALKDIFAGMHESQQQLERLNGFERRAAQQPKSVGAEFPMMLSVARWEHCAALACAALHLQTVESSNDPKWSGFNLTEQPRVS